LCRAPAASSQDAADVEDARVAGNQAMLEQARKNRIVAQFAACKMPVEAAGRAVRRGGAVDQIA
jgi:hypothetical protein